MQTGSLVSAAASPFDANHGPSATLFKHHDRRQSQRSNSLSSGSSAVPLQQPGPLSRVRSDSQSGEPDVQTTRRLSRDPVSQDHRRRKSVAIDPSESHASDPTGIAAVNRWSHSTTSSLSSSNKRRNRSSSGAVLSSIAGQSFSPRQKPLAAVDASPRASPSRRHVASQSIASSPSQSRRTSRAGILPPSLTALPSLHTTSSLTDPNDTESPFTTETIRTPFNHPSTAGDGYFDGEEIEMAKTTRVMMIRNTAAPMSVTNPNRAAASHSRDATKNVPPVSSENERRANMTGEGSGRNRRPRTKERVEKDKKIMLSKALQKANTAVLLDNAQNYEGALEAYGDACGLLTHVMDRTSGDDDKRKLDAIRVTYSNRMQELRQLAEEKPTTSDEKHLPARPMSDDSLSLRTPNGAPTSPIDSTLDSAYIEAPTARITDVPRLSYPRHDRDSFFERTMQAVETSINSNSHAEPTESTIAGAEEEQQQPPLQPQTVSLPPPEHAQYMPRPLSPRRPPPLPPASSAEGEGHWPEEAEPVAGGASEAPKDQADSTSWLDTIDESGSSCSDSVHSIDDLRGMRRKHIRGASGGTDPDFDAAFDAAVEAAYDEGFEPDLEARRKRLTALQRHAKNESIQVPASAIDEIVPGSFQASDILSLDPDEEEEERILDEITHDFSQSFNFDLQSKSALPRTSDSSGYSRSTWQSSSLSDRATNATSLSTVAEDGLNGRLSKSAGAQTVSTTRGRGESSAALPPPTAPPTIALPQLPGTSNTRAPGVRNRRLSGMNPKQLKIETSPHPPEGRKRASTFHHTASPFAEEHDEKEEDRPVLPTPSDGGRHEAILQSPPSLDFHAALDDASKPVDDTTVGHRPSYEEVSDSHLTRPQLFRKNKSSISLRGRTEHTLLLASPDVENGPGLFTPMSSTFMSFAAAKRVQDPLNSQRANFPAFAPDSIDGQQYGGGGIYLFDTSLSATAQPLSPRSPNFSPLPTGLEPCPESFLLRPFWLMRALQQTLTHPRGGFLSTKLFVPRAVWQTRGVKLKLVEDKVANCDLLTAALGRLANTDTYDADAVMDELQSFEEVMERVQATFTKKLGSDVGVHGVAGIFKDASAATMATAMGNAPGSEGASADKAAKSNSGKSYLTSWRKLRNKSSGAPLSGGSHHGTAKTPTEKDQHTMPSVPMTSFVPVERRGNKRDARNMSFEGPNQEYMESLARLFDGVQVLDQIARQVEDPGLKHSSPTHVGLELSIRHAAEFFGFFVCRFVLADLTLLMDKFIKRGTEWVLA